MARNVTRTKLVEAFKLLFLKHLDGQPPDWAWPYEPSCPLIGKSYRPSKGMLIYASAENFSWMHLKDAPDRFKDERVWDRYRACCEENEGATQDFFPNVGIQPVTNGGLFAAALLVAERLKLPRHATPRAFMETIAISNWCKFSVKSKNNTDYLLDLPKLAFSLPYVVAELIALAPKVALVPHVLWNNQLLRGVMSGASPATRFIAVPQFNGRVVHGRKLASFNRAARKLQRSFAGEDVEKWMSQVRSVNKKHAWRYLACLDKALSANKVSALSGIVRP